MEISVEALDQLRARANISYREAKELLEETGGDVIEALVYLEEKSIDVLHTLSEKKTGVLNRARHLAGQLHRKKVKVKIKDKTLAEIPVTIGALGTVLFPKLAAFGIIGLLVSHGSLEVNGDVVSSPEEDDGDEHF